MDLKYLRNYTNVKASQHPELAQDILQMYQLAKDEVLEGESETHEVELAINAIDELIEEGGGK